MVRRILAPIAASLLLYGLLFAAVLDRPLSLGMFRALIEAKLARGARLEGPKLVIIAGSNGPYSHRCETIEPVLGRPCVNAGIAVGIGLDYLFARWRPLLGPGDIVYLPLEQAQYSISAATNALGPDAAIMLRHDRATLWTLPLTRWAGAAFAAGPRAALMSLIEMSLAASGFADPRAAYTGEVNAWGDHIGHTRDKAAAVSAIAAPVHETAARIAAGHGTVIVKDFLLWARARDIRVIGGLPAGFAGHPIPEDTHDAIRAIYIAGRAGFLDLGDALPVSAFFDTADHLNEPAQIARSRVLAEALAARAVSDRVGSRNPL